MDKQIKVAIVGVGSCAKSLVEGIQYHKNTGDTNGIMYPNIGGYKVGDISFVLGFDVDSRKVGQLLTDALKAQPNCSMDFEGVEFIDIELIPNNTPVLQGPRLDGVSEHMLEYDDAITFTPLPDLGGSFEDLQVNYIAQLRHYEVDVVINYLPVGSNEASAFYLEGAIKAGCNIINCMPSYIATKDAKRLEQMAVDHKVTIIGSDMKSAYGASRLSEVLQGSILDAGFNITQHIQENKACGSTQGQEHIQTGRTANTDFLNMANTDRLVDKHISKENVLKGQNIVRDVSIAGKTLYAGPSLTVVQKPGSEYIGSDNKVAQIDLVAYGFGGARYELTARLSVQDSPNSAGIVVSAIRFCEVASELDIVGFLRGPSAYTQKTPPLQLTSSDAKWECDELADRRLTPNTIKQTVGVVDVNQLDYTFQKAESDYV